MLQRRGVWSSLGYDMVFGAVINDEGEDTQHYVDSAFAFNPISYGGGLGGPPLAELAIAPKRIYILI